MNPTPSLRGIVCILTLFTGTAGIYGADGTNLVPVKPTWRAVSAATRYTYPTRTIVDDNGDVLVAGSTSEPNAGSTNVWIAKYSGATGQVIWETTAYLGWTRDAALDSQGNLIVAGSSRVEWQDSFSVAKFSAQSGGLMWHRTNAGDRYSNDAMGVVVDSKDSVIVTGHLYRLDPTININAYTVKYSSAGAFQWEQEYDNPLHDSDFSGLVTVDAAGDVVVAGNSSAQPKVHLAKYSGTNGNPIWEKLYENGTQGTYVVDDLELDAAGNVVIGGSQDHGMAITDTYVASFRGSDGQRLWEYAPRHSEPRYESIKDLIIESDGMVFAVGFSVMDKYRPYLLRLAPGSGVAVWDLRLNEFGNSAQLAGITRTTRGELIAYGDAASVDSALFMSIDRPTGKPRWSFSAGTLSFGADTNQLIAATPDGGFASSRGEGPGRLASTRKFLPTVAIWTDAASVVAPGSIRLNGTVHPNGFSAKVWFEWGSGDSLTNSTPEQTVGGDTQLHFEATLSGLAGGRYSYRAVAQNGETILRGATLAIDLNTIPVAVNDFVTVPFRTEAVIDVLQNDSDADGDALQIVAHTQPQHGSVTLGEDGKFRFNPAGDFIGEDSFEYTITDNVLINGTVAQVSALVTIKVQRPSSVFIYPLLSTGDPVGGDENNVFAGFVNAGPGLILATIAPDTKTRGDEAIVDSTGHLVLKVGEPAPGLAAGRVIEGLELPSGRAFAATVRTSGRRAAPERVLFSRMDGGIVPIMLEGAPCRGLTGVNFKKLLAFDGSTDAVYFLASLKGPQVRPGSDRALWVAGADGIPRLILREGDLVDGDPARGITTLVPAPLSSGEQRWVQGDRIGVRLNLGSGREVLASIDTSVEPAQTTIVADTASGSGALYSSFSLPAFQDSSVAFVARLKGSKVRQRMVLDAGGGPITIAQTGTAAVGISGASFQELADPVLGANNTLAFAGTITGLNIGAGNNAGIWLRDEAGNLKLIARSGAEAPGASGSRWANFRALVFPDDATLGPVFSADLAIGKGITAATRGGLWAVDSSGAVGLLLRTGGSVSVNGTSKVVTGIRPVGAPKASVGGYDDIDGHVYVVATFADRSQSILKIVRP